MTIKSLKKKDERRRMKRSEEEEGEGRLKDMLKGLLRVFARWLMYPNPFNQKNILERSVNLM
jgi:hypothetical protein